LSSATVSTLANCGFRPQERLITVLRDSIIEL
jgi:hypothetical protein